MDTAMPKSVSTTRPSAPSRTLPGFTSRCSTPAACAALSAVTIRWPVRAASAGGRVPLSSSTSARVREGTYSMTMHGSAGPAAPAGSSAPGVSSTTSCTTMTLGCVILAALRASRRVRSWRRSRSSSERCGWTCMRFNATSRPRNSSSARHTAPMPPLPSSSRSRYRPAISRCCSDACLSTGRFGVPPAGIARPPVLAAALLNRVPSRYPHFRGTGGASTRPSFEGMRPTHGGDA